MRRRALPFSLALLALALLSAPALAERPDDDDDDKPAVMPAPAVAPMRMKAYDFSGMDMMGELAVTPGGAQDIRFFRDRVASGEVPHPSVFTPEGLFSEHDLPLESRAPCHEMICAFGEATTAAVLVQPEVQWLAQIGFSSGLTPADARRPPLNIVAVVDKSGSMSGHSIDMAKRGLHELVRQLDDGDRLTIVLYGDRTHVHLPATSGADRDRLEGAIDAIAIEGSTYMEAGLKLGFAEARRSAKSFPGLTRVMLFTDERPNVGSTDAESFMGMAEANSRAGIGMTTIGVGVQFGAELATKISSVRGGNLFFFNDDAAIAQTFGEELDTIVMELAYDMVLEVRPSDGFKIAGMYGVPGDMLEWTAEGGLRLGIATLFASKRAGGIYAAFSSAAGPHLPGPAPRDGDSIGTVSLAYSLRDGRTVSGSADLTWVAPERASTGVIRGALLVNQATALKEATRLHHEKNDQEGAYQLVHAIAGIYRSITDPDLASERTLVENLEATLAKLSGHQGEPSSVPPAPRVDPVTGLPIGG